VKFTYSMLKEFLNLNISPQEVAEVLDKQCAEVAELKEIGGWPNVVLGRIDEIEKHPNADKLKICRINVGDGYKQIITAAQVHEGMWVGVALHGAKLVSGTIKKTKLRGVLSEGMLCATSELGIDEVCDGVSDLQSELPNFEFRDELLGKDLGEALGLKDWLFEIEVNPNRPDLLGVVGVARELVAAGVAEYRGEWSSGYPIFAFDVEKSMPLSIRIEDPMACYRYTGAVFDVEVKKSDLRMRFLLKECGFKPINNVVDMTNFVMLMFGHPVHAFDYDKFGNEVVVNYSLKGEKFVSFTGEEIELPEGLLVIRNGAGKIGAVAGVVGSPELSVSDDTKRIVLEVAAFNPKVVRKSQKILGVTESSYRFVRFVDPDNPLPVVGYFAEGIKKKAVAYEDMYVNKVDQAKVKVNSRWLKRFLGFDATGEFEKMKRLGFAVNVEKDNVEITVPSWRIEDIKAREDVAEELLRLAGFDKAPSTLPHIVDGNDYPKTFDFKVKLSSMLRAAGYDEIVTNSLVEKGELRLENPASEKMAYYRKSLLPELLHVVLRRFNFGGEMFKVFEIGNVYVHGAERLVVAAVAGGKEEFWHATHEFGYQWIKYALELMERAFGVEFKFVELDKVKVNKKEVDVDVEDSGYLPGKVAAILYNDVVVGTVGMIYHGELEDVLERTELFAFELCLDSFDFVEYRLKPVFDMAAAKRDIALLVPNGVTAREIEKVFARNRLIESYRLFDVYTGKWQDKRSLAWRLIFRSDKKLTDKEVDKEIKKILKDLEKLGVVLRDE